MTCIGHFGWVIDSSCNRTLVEDLVWTRAKGVLAWRPIVFYHLHELPCALLMMVLMCLDDIWARVKVINCALLRPSENGADIEVADMNSGLDALLEVRRDFVSTLSCVLEPTYALVI